MSAGRYIAGIWLICAGTAAYGQKEALPETRVPLNQTDNQGKRDGPWWITTPSHKGEPAVSKYGTYSHGTKFGKWYTIDNEGDIAAVEMYRDDMLDGEVKYYTNGIMYCSGSYKAFNSDGVADTVIVVNSDTHEETQREIVQDPVSLRHGTWRFYDEQTGKLLREEEYQVDSLIYKKNYVSPADSTALRKRELAMPHNQKKYRKKNSSQG
ncbi:MAG: hypothetical protein JNL72_00120 [Flavipsychrobacter sp.]|nr:hypothetical protein [Flavipsychrobacter sp.]